MAGIIRISCADDHAASYSITKIRVGMIDICRRETTMQKTRQFILAKRLLDNGLRALSAT